MTWTMARLRRETLEGENLLLSRGGASESSQVPDRQPWKEGVYHRNKR